MVIGSGVWDDVKSLIAGVLLSHAFSGELKAVSIVNEAVQDCVAEGGYLLEGIDWRMPQHTWRPQAAG